MHIASVQCILDMERLHVFLPANNMIEFAKLTFVSLPSTLRFAGDEAQLASLDDRAALHNQHHRVRAAFEHCGCIASIDSSKLMQPQIVILVSPAAIL